MNTQLICIPFAYENGMNTGVNVDSRSALQIYLKNVCVALCSTKYYNKDCDVALITNLYCDDIPAQYRNLLDQSNVKIITVPFDQFRFPKTYLWSLAFYKLCVLKYLTQTEYKAICYLDADVYTQGSFEAIWKECNEHLLLYDINHGLNTKDYRIICEEIKSFLGHETYCTHYGGEFFAANIYQARAFCVECEKIYQEMIDTSFVTTKGDEFILSLAAERMKERVKNAGAYIFRFWTGIGFRLVSTCYQYNRIVVLHVPNEKGKGMLKLYDKYISQGKIPGDSVCWRILGLPSVRLKEKIKGAIRTVLVTIGVLKR